MGSIGAGFSMSLDGFIAGEGNDVSRLFHWMSLGNTDVKLERGDSDIDLQVSSGDAEQFQERISQTGAIISGRGMFDVAGAWGGKHPMNVPIVVVTHSVPVEWVYAGSPLIFISEGVERAVEVAREIAGEKNIGVGGAEITRQCLKLALMDEIGIDLVPILLGGGVRLFERLGIEPVDLEITNASRAPGVVHLLFKVIK